jgi:dTDP-4-dehydrorhamnose 3,5-epimerase
MAMWYLVDAEFTGEDEFGFAWDDPEAGIPWPLAEPIVSERDRSAGTFAQALHAATAFPGGPQP